MSDPDDKTPQEKKGERVAEQAIEVLDKAAEEKRPLGADERKVVRELRTHPEARREFRRTRFWVSFAVIAGLLVLATAVYALVLWLAS